MKKKRTPSTAILQEVVWIKYGGNIHVSVELENMVKFYTQIEYENLNNLL